MTTSTDAAPGLPSVLSAQCSVLVEAAWAEDLGWGDVTTDAVVGPVGGGRTARAELLVKADGVLAGLPVAMAPPDRLVELAFAADRVLVY